MTLASLPSDARLVSLVAPAFNEEASIEPWVAEVARALDQLGRAWEIVCVDDGSTDGTLIRLEGLRRVVPGLRVLALDGHGGQSAALHAGVQAARGAIVVLMDADLQNDPADIGPMLALLDAEPALAAVVGRRAQRRDGWIRRVSSRIANRIAAGILAEPTRDAGCGLKAFRAPILRKLPAFRGNHRFLAALVRLEGGTVREIAVEHRPRQQGRSRYGAGLGRTFTALGDALAVRWMQSRKLRSTAKEPGRAATGSAPGEGQGGEAGQPLRAQGGELRRT